MADKITVIIPVYNTEKYLHQCVTSVLNQTHKNMQIILVNDGSTDGSAAICDTFAASDSRIEVLHKQNAGLASARNAGLTRIKGDSVLFLDSDDYYYDTACLATLNDFAKKNNCDVVCFNYMRYYDSINAYSSEICRLPKDESNSICSLIKHNVYTSSVCIKLIKASLIFDNSITFEHGRLSEDIEFSAKILQQAKNIKFCPQAIYVYRERSDSITTNFSKKHIDDLLCIIKKLYAENDIDQKAANAHTSGNVPRQSLPHYMDYVAFQYATLLINIHLAKAHSSVKKDVYSLKKLLDYDHNSSVRLVHLCSKIFGIRLASCILYAYFRLSAKLNKLKPKKSGG